MHKNCFEFPLKTEIIVKEYVREKFKLLNTETIYAQGIDLPADILNQVNEELAESNLKISSGIAFKRKNYFKPLAHRCHIDYSSVNQQIVKSSIVIPIDGCEDTFMYWYDGNYTTAVVMPRSGNPSTYPYMNISWKVPGTLLEKVEISKGPMLCRVDIPHSATSKLDGTYRLVMSLRFEENLSIEEIIARRSSMDRTSSS
jgi:hypothetical protein